MNDLPRTPWFGGFECPVREGVYERKLYNYHIGEELIVYSYWDGTQWYIGAYSPDDAMRVAELGPTMTLYREWRGLANESHTDI
jgi:hypothetical protein